MNKGGHHAGESAYRKVIRSLSIGCGGIYPVSSVLDVKMVH